MEEYSKNVIDSANQNKEELISQIQEKIEQLQKLRLEFDSDNNEEIRNFLEVAKARDVNFVPDKTIVSRLSYYIENLINVKQVLLELVLDEENVFDKEKYLSATQNLLDKIDKQIEDEKANAIKVNKRKLTQMCEEKISTEFDLESLRIELEKLELEKSELEKENAEFQRKINKSRFKIFKGMHEEELEFNKTLLVDIEDEINKVKAKINKLEIINEANHFVSKPEGKNPVNPNSEEVLEINEGIEPADE